MKIKDVFDRKISVFCIAGERCGSWYETGNRMQCPLSLFYFLI